MFKEILDGISLDRLFKIEGHDTGCLGYMGIGMLGIMMIIAIIVGATYLTNNLANKLSKPKNDD